VLVPDLERSWIWRERCLFVRPENAPAVRVYDAIGMRRVFTYRSIIF
jgi:predicted GNAT family acetyltransferase